MSVDTKDIRVKMSDLHDKIKSHPFRYNFEAEYISDYKHLLYQLSELWSGFIYQRDENRTKEEQRLLYQFGDWIHNYRQELRTYHKTTFPMEYFDYYEQMLQMTHIFVDTGIMDRFYSIDIAWSGNTSPFKSGGKREDYIETYQLVTTEICGINSPYLPAYLPLKRSMVLDEDVIQEYVQNAYPYRNKAEEERLQIFEDWKVNVKPIIEWLDKSQRDGEQTEYRHGTWMSLKYIRGEN